MNAQEKAHLNCIIKKDFLNFLFFYFLVTKSEKNLNFIYYTRQFDSTTRSSTRLTTRSTQLGSTRLAYRELELDLTRKILVRNHPYAKAKARLM